MKQMTAWLAAVCLIATCILPVRAAETSGMDSIGITHNNADSDSRQNENNQEIRTQEEEKGIATPSLSPSAWDLPGEKDGENASGADEGSKEGVQTTPLAIPQAAIEATPLETPQATIEATPLETLQAAPSMTPSASPSVQPPSIADGSWNDRQISSDGRGGIEVILMNALPIHESSRIALTVTLENAESREVVLERNAEKHLVLFDDLPSGTYHLKICENETNQMGFGFLAYEQDIEVKGDIKTAEVYTGFVELEGVAYTMDAPHPGVMLIGDVNRDGKIDGPCFSDRSYKILTESIGVFPCQLFK